MTEQVFTNYRLQLPAQELLGTLVVREGLIADIQPGKVSTGIDGNGSYLLPGLIELHTDNVEKCVSPRPKVEWPVGSAVMYHDRQIIGSGITTVFDAISVGDIQSGSIRMTHSRPIIDALLAGQAAGKFAADHRLHLRSELSYEPVFSVISDYTDHPALSLISLMDHTPGQRQYTRLDKYKEYYMGKHGVSAAEMDQFIQDRQLDQQQHSQRNREALVQLAQSKNITLASHDDATLEHIQEAVEAGVSIAEFPTTLEAAQAAHQQGLFVLMGAPNIVLGGSHSGNISALELAQQDCLDILSSDYVPQSLLEAVFIIAHKTGKPLYETTRLVTLHPAKACHLDSDRGSLEVGKCADLVTVQLDNERPQITSVFKLGLRVG